MGVLIMRLSIVGTPTMDIPIKDTPDLEGDSYAELWSDSRQRIEYS